MGEQADISALDLQNDIQAQQMLEMQRAAYLVEARLINFDEIPPLLDTLDTLQACEETFWGCYVEGVLAGAISYKVDEQTLDIHRMMVHPDYLWRGIATKLLRFVEAHVSNVECIIVSTGSKNSPAIRLYQQHGFNEIGQQEIVPDLMITHLEKRLSNT